ncbi:RNA-binding domain-containing protein, partial [Lichtheimia hyalospora FSU 10163]
SRLIVKNLPKLLTEEDFREHFAAKGQVTDAKLMKTAQGVSRRFGFIGYRTADEAQAALDYFNNTYINTSRIVVEKALPYRSEALPRAWSRHTEGSSAYERTHGASAKNKDDYQVEETDAYKEQQRLKDQHVNKLAAAENDPKLQEFLDVMTSRSKGKTWANDDTGVLKGGKDGDTEGKVKFAADSDDDLYEDLPAKKPKDEGDDGSDDEQFDNDVSMGQPSRSGSNKSTTHAIESMDIDNEPRNNSNQVDKDAAIAQIEDTGRLFVRNLTYTCTEADLKELFSPYGPLSEVNLPVSKDTKRPKGYAYIGFLLPEHAVQAYQDQDMKFFQGRLMHIIPAKEKPQAPEQEILGPNGTKLSKSDAVTGAIADRLGLSKSEVLDPNSSNMAVRLALAETNLVNETKEFFEKHGIVLDSFGKKERSDTIILVKNTPFGTSEDDLRELFGKYGDLGRVLVPPAQTMGVVEFIEPSEARAAFKALAYRRYKDTLIYLEKAPVGLFKDKTSEVTMAGDKKDKSTAKTTLTGADLIDSTPDTDDSDVATLFVKNLNFSTTPEGLRKVFSGLDGYRSSRINVKNDFANPGKTLSMGYGFVEFDSKASAQKALNAMQGYNLDDHALQLKFSHSNPTGSTKKNVKKAESTKLVVHNVPFEATEKELRELFSAYGQLKSLRAPKKFNGGHRGFAFMEFTTKQEAKNVFESMGNIHLYGRHLVLDWAKDEEGVDALREKTGRSYAKEERLGGRVNKKRKVDLDGDNDHEMLE